MRVTLQDVMRVHFCNRRVCRAGMRRFCVEHGFDWNDFLDHGVDAEELLATGDAMAFKIVNEIRGN